MTSSPQSYAEQLRAQTRPWRDKYTQIVNHFRPCAPVAQADLRCSLLQLRDLASSRLIYCSDEALESHWKIIRLVSEFAFSPLNDADLMSLRASVGRLMLRATNLDEIEIRNRKAKDRGA